MNDKIVSISLPKYFEDRNTTAITRKIDPIILKTSNDFLELYQSGKCSSISKHRLATSPDLDIIYSYKFLVVLTTIDDRTLRGVVDISFWDKFDVEQGKDLF